MDLIDKLAELLGFYSSYTGTFGGQVVTPTLVKGKLLKAMGFELDEASLKTSITQLTERQWLKILPSVHIAKCEEQQHYMTISLPATAQQSLAWMITTQAGHEITNSIDITELQCIDQQQINDRHYRQYQLPLPTLAQGYHQLSIDCEGIKADCALIFAPKNCYSYEQASKTKVWGYTTQLYSLRSENNWGIGDFSDLIMLSKQASEQQAALVGLNPLHALFKHNPSHRSPYSPSSRNFLNPIYIDVTHIENYLSFASAQSKLNSEEFQHRIIEAKAAKLVDYPAVAALKYEIIELLFKDFLNKKEQCYQQMSAEFEDFKNEYANELYQFSTFDALYEHFNTANKDVFGWSDWSEEFQDPNHQSVKNFQQEYASRIEFSSFLQWTAHRQLSAAALYAKQKMAIGLYLDLAVGCDGSGADVWSNKSLYVAGASIGAPPDNLNSLGQNWGLTPISPVALQSQGYQPLVSALRSIMQYAGAIRIDHILGLMRQYWVAPGMAANEGAYIHFPFDDILRVIALESQRNKCVVIGEDLGNVPAGFSQKINDAELLSFKVMFFERWDSGLFKRPENFPAKSVSTVSTHDTPTLTGWWQGRDLQWRQQLNLYPNQAAGNADRNARAGDRQNLIAALEDWQVINSDQAPEQHPPIMNNQLSISVQQYLASSPSHIQLISLEDALEIPEQVNIPGTIDEHPNWLQKLPVMLEDLSRVKSVDNIGKAMMKARPINH
jgi:4-alpha-glucanotransferase